MANVGGIAQLMETVGTPAPQTASTSPAPAQSFATAMQQANTDAGVPSAPPAPPAKSAPAGAASPSAADAENGSKQETAGQTAAAGSIPAAGTPETVAKTPAPASIQTNSQRYTSANLLTGLLTRSGNQAAPVPTQTIVPKAPAANTATDALQATSKDAVPPANQAAPAPVTPVAPAVANPSASLKASSAPAGGAALETAPPSSSSSPVASDGTAAAKPAATASRQAAKPEAPVTSSAAAVAPLQSGITSTPSVQIAAISVLPTPVASQVQAAAADNPAASTQPTVDPVSARTSLGGNPSATAASAQARKPFTPQSDPAEVSAELATGKTQPAAPTSFPAVAIANGAPTPAADGARFTPAIAAPPDGNSALQTPSQPVAPGTATGANAFPSASTNAVKVGPPSTLPAAAARQTLPAQPSLQTLQTSTAAAPTPPSLQVSSATNASVIQQTVPRAPANAPAAAPQKANAKGAAAVNAIATTGAAAAQGPVPSQPGAVAAAAKDTNAGEPKDTSHTAAVPVAAVQPASQVWAQAPAALPGDTAVPATAPVQAAHTPVALTALSNPGGPPLGGTASTTTASGLGGDTVPHTTLTSTPTTLEVGVSSGTHGWLKIRAELNASGTVDASLSGANAAATGRLHNDLPALSSFLQNEKVALGSLNVAAPGASASALHATAAAATLEPVSSFTRSAAEAVGAAGTAVASDAGAPGGRAPHQEAPQAHLPLANPPEDDGLAGAVTAPVLYGDANDPGNTGALASGSYNGGGSWLNVRV